MENFVRPAFLTLAGGFLAAQPFFSDTRWEWNGLPTNMVGYFFLGGGLLWLAGATVSTLRERPNASDAAS